VLLVTRALFAMLIAGLLQASSIPLRTLDRGAESQLDDARQVAVRSAAEWTTLWQRHAGERERPSVDFAREMVVGVFLGSRPTAGFSIEIVRAREDGQTLVVEYRETRARSDAVTAQVLTSPYHIVAAPTHRDVRFERVQ
jgi:PrcB C-terminal